MSPSVVAGIALLASRFLPHSANIKILSVAGEKYKITKLNSVNRKVLLKEKREASVYLKKTCVHKGVVVGGGVLRRNLRPSLNMVFHVSRGAGCTVGRFSDIFQAFS